MCQGGCSELLGLWRRPHRRRNVVQGSPCPGRVGPSVVRVTGPLRNLWVPNHPSVFTREGQGPERAWGVAAGRGGASASAARLGLTLPGARGLGLGAGPGRHWLILALVSWAGAARSQGSAARGCGAPCSSEPVRRQCHPAAGWRDAGQGCMNGTRLSATRARGRGWAAGGAREGGGRQAAWGSS